MATVRATMRSVRRLPRRSTSGTGKPSTSRRPSRRAGRCSGSRRCASSWPGSWCTCASCGARSPPARWDGGTVCVCDGGTVCVCVCWWRGGGQPRPRTMARSCAGGEGEDRDAGTSHLLVTLEMASGARSHNPKSRNEDFPIS